MKRSICTIAWKKSGIGIAEILPAVATAGYDGAEIWQPHVDPLTPDSRRKLKAQAADLDIALPVLGAYIGTYDLKMSNASEMLARMINASAIASELGIPYLRAFVGWTCECSSITASEPYWKYVTDGFKAMASVAEKNNQTIVAETHKGTLVDSVNGCRQLMKSAGRRVKINLQIDDIVELSKLPDAASVYRELKNDVVHSHLNVHEMTNRNRADLKALYSAMKANGYSGFISLENCTGIGEPAAILKDGMALMDELGV